MSSDSAQLIGLQGQKTRLLDNIRMLEFNVNESVDFKIEIEEKVYNSYSVTGKYEFLISKLEEITGIARIAAQDAYDRQQSIVIETGLIGEAAKYEAQIKSILQDLRDQY